MSYLRKNVVNLAKSWIGKKESDGSFKEILDIYNSYKGKLPRGVKIKYSDPWCAATWSALAVKLGYTDIMPIEISCRYLIENAKKMGIWKESDSYVPNSGDAILYDWDDNGKGDNVGTPDHVGVVEYVSGGHITVIEGNYSNSVKRRTLSVNGKFIRGFITPNYDDEMDIIPEKEPNKSIKEIAHEVINGVWGNGAARKKALEENGYNYAEVQKMVNEILNGSVEKNEKPVTNNKEVSATVYAKNFSNDYNNSYITTSNLYCRNDAGTNKKALCLIPKDTIVRCYGFYNTYNDEVWLYIQVFLNGITYTGFSSLKYLKKVD